MRKQKVNKELLDTAKAIKIDKSPGSLYNSWRSKVFTQKGKVVGFPDKWKTYTGFCDDMRIGWQRGKILCRRNQALPYSKDNCFWSEKSEAQLGKLSKLSYKGQTKTLVEWCVLYQLNYNGVRQRFFKGKNYSSEEILFGKKLTKSHKVMSIFSIRDSQKQANKITKMLSAYRCKDRKRGLNTTITKEYLEDIIRNSKCVYCGDTHNIGLDRIDNNRGHEIGNVVPCCYECNVARSNNFSMEEMKVIGSAIRKIKKMRNETKAD